MAPTNPGAFEKAGIPFCLTTSDLRDLKTFFANLRTAFNYGLTDSGALNALTKTTGPGCGGKKQCVVDNEAAIGMTRYNKGNFVFLASVKTSGTNMMKPAL